MSGSCNVFAVMLGAPSSRGRLPPELFQSRAHYATCCRASALTDVWSSWRDSDYHKSLMTFVKNGAPISKDICLTPSVRVSVTGTETLDTRNPICAVWLQHLRSFGLFEFNQGKLRIVSFPRHATQNILSSFVSNGYVRLDFCGIHRWQRYSLLDDEAEI